MAADIKEIKILINNQQQKCEMCGNEALPLQTLCKEHLDVRVAEQLKGREYLSNSISGHPIS